MEEKKINRKFNIASVKQDMLIELDLDIKDAYILTYIRDLIGTKKMIQKIKNDEVYFWVKYEALMNYLPILQINNDKVLGRRISKYEKLGLLKRHIHRKYNPELCKVSNGYTFLKLEEKFQQLFETDKIDDGIEEMKKISEEMGLSTVGTQKCFNENKEELKSAHNINHSKVPTVSSTEKLPHNTKIKDTKIKDTTTNNKSSSPFYEFLESEEFSRVNEATKGYISKIDNLTYESFKEFYEYSVSQDKEKPLRDFNRFLFTALKANWNIKKSEKTVKKPKKDVEIKEGLMQVTEYKIEKVTQKEYEEKLNQFLKTVDPRTKNFSAILYRKKFEIIN